jgi:hypothetical protein
MKIDTLIKQRFSELEAQIAQVERAYGAPGCNKSDEAVPRWATSVLNLLQRVFGEDSIHYQNFYEEYNHYRYSTFSFSSCKGIFYAAKDDYENGCLFNVRALVKAEVLVNDVLGQAVELLSKGYRDPACVLAGVALETTLKELCTRQDITHSKLDRMNVDLCKAGVYNMAKQKQITAWAELRNRAAHGDWAAYNEADARDFIEGVERFIADYL